MNLTWPSMSRIRPPSPLDERIDDCSLATFHTYSARFAGLGLSGPTRPRSEDVAGAGGSRRAAKCCFTARSIRPSRWSRSNLSGAEARQPRHRITAKGDLPGVCASSNWPGGSGVDALGGEAQTVAAAGDAAITSYLEWACGQRLR